MSTSAQAALRIALVCAGSIHPASPALAQTRTAVVARAGEDRALGARIERVIRHRLDEADVAGEIVSSPLAWGDLELITGCVGEDAECLALIAAQLDVTELLLASAECSAGNCVIELLRWGPAGIASRLLDEHGDQAQLAILGDLGDAIRALYDLPPAPIAERPAGSLLVADRHSFDPTGPIVLGAIALAALGCAVAAAVAAGASRAAGQVGPTATRHEVDATVGARDRAQTETIAADVLFALAGAAAIAGVTWLIVEIARTSGNADAARALTGWVTF